MNKAEFLAALRHALGKLPSYEVEATLTFYAEMIDDRVEDGMSETDAVAALGSVQAIAAQIIAETPPIPRAIAKANTGSKTLNIVLLAILSPFWVSIALMFIITVLSVYLAIWAVVVSLWAVVASLLLCGIVGIVGLAWLSATGYPLSGLWVFGAGLACVGIGLFAWFGVMAASRGLINLTHSFARSVKSLFVKLKSPGTDDAAPHSTSANPTQPLTGGPYHV